MRNWLSIILLLGIMISSSASQTDKNLKRIQDLNSKTWELIKLYETSEEMFIMFFGTPDLVTLHCSYDDLKKANYSGNGLDVSNHIFEYDGTRGDLNILKGPVGLARSAKVWITENKVVEVDWDYGGPYRDAAETFWKSDSTIKTVKGELFGYSHTSMGTKKISDNGTLYISCFANARGECIDHPEVMLMRESPSNKK